MAEFLATKAFKVDTDNWEADGDATIAASLATLDDPVTTEDFGLRTWGWLPTYPDDYDEDGNIWLPYNTQLEMMHADLPYSVADAEFFIWLRREGDWETDDDTIFRIRLDTLTEDQLQVVLEGLAATQSTHVYNEDGGTVLDDRAELETVFPEGEWRLLVVRSVGAVMHIEVLDDAGTIYKSAVTRQLDRTDAGTFGIYVGGASRIWYAGTTDSGIGPPGFGLPKSGNVRMVTLASWTLPLTFTRFNTMTKVYNTTYDAYSDNVNDVTLYYNLYHAGAWTGWLPLDADGDMSAISANPLDRLLVGMALTNDSQLRTRPAVALLDVNYYREAVSTVSTMREVCSAIKDALDGDGTVTSFTGWDSNVGCIICYESQRARWALNGTCGIFICPQSSPSEKLGEGKVGTTEVTVAAAWRNIAIYPTVQVASANPSDVATADDGLEALTEAIWEALKATDFADAVKWADLEGPENDVGGGYRASSVHTKVNRITLSSFVGTELT